MGPMGIGIAACRGYGPFPGDLGKAWFSRGPCPAHRPWEPTCVVTVVVRVPQAGVGLVHAARVVAQLSTRVRVALAGHHTLPAARLVLVIGVVLLVLDAQPLRLLHEGTLLSLTQQAGGQRAGAG